MLKLAGRKHIKMIVNCIPYVFKFMKRQGKYKDKTSN